MKHTKHDIGDQRPGPDGDLLAGMRNVLVMEAVLLAILWLFWEGVKLFMR